MTPIITQQISNHPVFTDVERYVDVTLQSANSNAKLFEMYFDLRYIRNGEDVTATLQQPSVNRIYTDATKKQLLRDADFQPIPNPYYNPDDFNEANPVTDYDMYQWVYGWDMIQTLMNQPTNIAQFIQQYILINDQEGFFNS